MLRFTKGCKAANVAGGYFLQPQLPLQLRIASQIARHPTKRPPIPHLHIAVFVHWKKIDYHICLIQGKGRQVHSNLALAGAYAKSGHRAYIVDAIGSLYRAVDSLFLITN